MDWALRFLGVGNASAVELGSAMAVIERDGQPWLTWWLPLPGIAVALTWGAYQAVSAAEPGLEALLAALVWPGSALFVITTLVTYFGWRLDLD